MTRMCLYRTMNVAAILACAGSAMAQNIGPSTTTSPYVIPVAGTGGLVSTTSIFTVGDTIGGYKMVGIPDGLGAIKNDDGTFDLLMNHELGNTAGVTRAHGSTGAFVSRWNISNNLTVNSGRDHNTSASDVFNWNGTGYTQGTTSWTRFCSADLAPATAYKFGSLGTDARIYMNGEESGAEGRAYAHIASGPAINTSYQLPYLGRFSWENSIANPKAQAKTIVMGNDDSTVNGGVYMYVGNKASTGNDIQKAGLSGGNLYGIKVNGAVSEDRNAPYANGTRFSLFNHGDVSNKTGATLNSEGVTNGVTNFLRPEDGAWDARPGQENNYYFVTTDRFNDSSQTGRSRLWRMTFDDIANPENGGKLDCLLDGTQGQQMFDNITIDSHGRVLLQEDVGGNAHLGKIWLYDTASAKYGVIAQHDSKYFSAGGSSFLTIDEEASGIIDAKDILGDGWFLMDTQAHYGIAGELVEGGQLMAMYVDPSLVPAPGALTILGLGGLLVARRKR